MPVLRTGALLRLRPRWAARASRRGTWALLLALLIAALLPFALASPHPTVIRVLMPAVFADATAPQVRRFNTTHADLRIEVARGPVDTDTMSDLAISGLILGDTPYDVLMVDVNQVAKFAAAGWVEPLERWLGEDILEGMVPGARLGNVFDGHIWRMPLTGDTGLLYWRTDLMERPPRTPDELIEVASSLQREGRVRWGYVWQGRQYEGLSCVVLEVLHAFGAQWWQAGGSTEPVASRRDQDGADTPAVKASARPTSGALPSGKAPVWPGGRTRLGTPQAARAAAWLNRLIREGITPPAVANYAEAEALATFATGDAAMLRNWPYAWRELERMGAPVVGKVAVTTVVGQAGEPGSGTLGTWGFSLLTDRPHPRQAAEVIRWLTSPEFQRQMAIQAGYAPTWQSLYDDADLARRHPLLAVQRRALENPALRPPTPLYTQLSDVLQRQMNGMLTGYGDGAEAMARAQSQSDLVLRAAAGLGRDGP